jgi:hypothetical protein
VVRSSEGSGWPFLLIRVANSSPGSSNAELDIHIPLKRGEPISAPSCAAACTGWVQSSTDIFGCPHSILFSAFTFCPNPSFVFLPPATNFSRVGTRVARHERTWYGYIWCECDFYTKLPIVRSFSLTSAHFRPHSSSLDIQLVVFLTTL